MKNAILLHGTCSKNEYYNPEYPTASNNHWFPWISKQLAIRNIAPTSIEIPECYDEKLQDYDFWAKELERFEITPETVLVGHSFGTGFFMRYLSENKINIDKLILVAPWFDPESIHDNFFDFDIDPTITTRIKQIIVIYSTDDIADVIQGVEKLKSNVPDIKYLEFQDKGHLTLSSLGQEEFPELLEEILKDA